MTLATASLRDVLSSTTLAVLAERDLAIEAGTYPIPADAHPHATVVAIADSVQAELPAATVAARLRTGSSWLTRHAEACDEEELRVKVGPARVLEEEEAGRAAPAEPAGPWQPGGTRAPRPQARDPRELSPGRRPVAAPGKPGP